MPDFFLDGDLVIDFESRQVTLRGEPVSLRPSEYRLLCHLVDNVGRIVRNRELIQSVWGPEYAADTYFPKVVASVVRRLRQKIDLDSRHSYIVGKCGVGYGFVRPGDACMPPPPDFQAGDLAIDFANQREVTVRGERVQLNATEYRLLSCLVDNIGRPVPYRELMARVWGYDESYAIKDLLAPLASVVRRLRQKIDPDSGHSYIERKRGVGYRFVRPPDPTLG